MHPIQLHDDPWYLLKSCHYINNAPRWMCVIACQHELVISLKQCSVASRSIPDMLVCIMSD